MQETSSQRVLNTFQAIAEQYDRMNAIISLGMHHAWRRQALDCLDIQPGCSALDVGCGTGDLTLMLAERVGPGGQVVGLDFSPSMLQVGRDKCRRHQLTNVQLLPGDALALPCRANSFDYVTTAFALRNFPNLRAALQEMQRVLRPGGKLLVLDFSHPPNRLLRRVAAYCLEQIVPWVAGRLVRRHAEYSWLAESLRRYPDSQELIETLKTVGLGHACAYLILGGVVAFHIAEKPGSASRPYPRMGSAEAVTVAIDHE